MKRDLIKTILLLLCAAELFAVDTGGYAGAYLRMPVSARAVALGNSTASLTNDLSAVFENPALSATYTGKQANSSVQFLSLDRSHNSLSIGLPMPPTAGLSLGWIHAGVRNIEGRDYSNNYTETYTTSQDAMIVAFANQIVPWMSVGISAKIYYDQLPEVSATGVGLDLGILFRPFTALDLAFVAKDIRSNINWDTRNIYEYGTQKTDNYPTQYLVSATFNFLDRMLLTGTFKGSTVLNPTYHFGIELPAYNNSIFLRAGVDNTVPVFGLGTYYTAWKQIATQIDYAFIFGTVGEGASHVFSWQFYF